MTQYEAYVNANPDLLQWWQSEQAKGSPITKDELGQMHWANSGQKEGRTLPPVGNGVEVNNPNLPGSPAPDANATPTLPGPTQAAPTPAPNTTNGFSALVPQQQDAHQAALPDVPGSNTSQVQNANQVGAYTNTGQTNTAQAQTTGQSTVGKQAQNTATTGTQNTNTTGAEQSTQNIDQTTKNTGTNTNEAVDSLGFGALLKGQQGAASADDATRRTFLSDLVNNGGSAMNSQFDQAIRGSLTGPQITGAGDSARARSSGYAAAQIARQNTDQRLNAAGQLAGPTATTTLSQAANPYIGQKQTADTTARTTGQNTTNTTSASNTGQTSSANQASTGTSSSDQTGFSKLLGSTNETGSGAATGSSSQAASGIALKDQTSGGGGGCVLCTAAIDLELPGANLHRVLRTVISHKLHKDWKNFRYAARGYFFLFTPLARWLLSHRFLASKLWPIAKAVVYEELRVAGRPLPFHFRAWTAHWMGHALCAVVGRFPVPGCVKDKVILSIAQKEGILFEVQK